MPNVDRGDLFKFNLIFTCLYSYQLNSTKLNTLQIKLEEKSPSVHDLVSMHKWKQKINHTKCFITSLENVKFANCLREFLITQEEFEKAETVN